MGQFIIVFDTDNSAFADDPTPEITRILRETARRVSNGNTAGFILDVNGNRVGKFNLAEGS
jgi:hypothetical protein